MEVAIVYANESVRVKVSISQLHSNEWVNDMQGPHIVQPPLQPKAKQTKRAISMPITIKSFPPSNASGVLHWLSVHSPASAHARPSLQVFLQIKIVFFFLQILINSVTVVNLFQLSFGALLICIFITFLKWWMTPPSIHYLTRNCKRCPCRLISPAKWRWVSINSL